MDKNSPFHSLKSLIELFFGVTIDKTLQEFEWKIRPLSKEMLEYATTDSYYLLYLYSLIVSLLMNPNTILTNAIKLDKIPKSMDDLAAIQKACNKLIGSKLMKLCNI